MPPWVAAAPRLSSLTYGRAIERLPTALRCRHAPKASYTHLRVRAASTHVSPTTINLRPNIPARNKELHDALSALGGVAENYVNTSRLQLAIEGLAAQDPVTRVAVLNSHSQGEAHRLAQLLLADPLGAEEPWEKELVQAGKDGEKPVLLKFGQEADSNSPSPLYKVLSIPSRVLRTHNLEILVSTLESWDVVLGLPTQVDSPMDAMLVPRIRSASERMQSPKDGVPFPVHKTLVLGKGLDGAVGFGRYTSEVSDDLHEYVKLAITVPPPLSEKDLGPQDDTVAVNTQVGAEALATFRESIQNSIAYERGWFRSGLPPLSDWLTHDLEPSTPIKPVLKKLITSIADDTRISISRATRVQREKLVEPQTARVTFTSVTNHLETWAEKSHTELRDELDNAFFTRNWHKLAWWKLLWRVDDVTMISTELLERRWLVSAEKSSIYLAGRMNQAGFPDEIQLPPATDQPAVVHVTTEENAPTASNPGLDMSTEVRKSIPWPEHISASRTELINDTVPPLQALAQRLILQTFSTTALSSAASALLYVTMSSLSIFEAASIGVLGLTISLRRMQKMWEGAREHWEGTVREEGRRTLKGTEEAVRTIIAAKVRSDAGLGVEEDEGAKERREAQEAVEKVREALEKLEKGGNSTGDGKEKDV